MPNVLLTSFGPFGPLLPTQTNPSQLITTRLPKNLISSSGTPITLITPSSPLPAAYHVILSTVPKIIQDHDLDLIIHMGYATDQTYFSVEKSAAKEGYHEVPDVDRKVFMRAETKKVFGKGPPEILVTALDVEAAVQEALRNLGKNGKGKKGTQGKGRDKGERVDVKATDDVGNFVCGFIYYLGLWEMEKKGKAKNVVFLHCPLLETEEQINTGVRVAEELVKALVDQLA